MGSCGGAGEPSPPFQLESDASPARSDGSGLSGRVTWSGPPQADPGSGTVADPCSGSGAQVAESVGPEGGLADVVVLVENAPPAADEPRSLELSAQQCRFHPTVAAVPMGGRLVADNRDERLHTFHLRRQHPEGGLSNLQNLAVPPGEPPASFIFDAPGPLHVSSDDVPGMEAWVLVYERGQSAVTDARGQFELPELPPGEWQVTFWHPRFGRKLLPVLIPKDGPASLYASLPPSP